jgi:hypothetical protein
VFFLLLPSYVKTLALRSNNQASSVKVIYLLAGHDDFVVRGFQKDLDERFLEGWSEEGQIIDLNCFIAEFQMEILHDEVVDTGIFGRTQ